MQIFRTWHIPLLAILYLVFERTNSQCRMWTTPRFASTTAVRQLSFTDSWLYTSLMRCFFVLNFTFFSICGNFVFFWFTSWRVSVILRNRVYNQGYVVCCRERWETAIESNSLYFVSFCSIWSSSCIRVTAWVLFARVCHAQTW